MLSRVDAHASGQTQWSYSATMAFISALCVVVVGHDLFRTWQDRNHQLENARREVANLAWAAEQHAEDVFRLASTRLIGLGERVAAEGTDPGQLERLRRLMAQQQSGVPTPLSWAVIGETGDLLTNGEPVVPRLYFADRDYFQYHRAHDDPDPHVSLVPDPGIGDNSSVVVSRRVTRADGTFAGVVASAIDVAWFQSFYATLDLGHDGVAGLYRDDGLLLVRQPFLEKAAGGNAQTFALVRDLLPQASLGSYETASPLDGVTRIVSWRRVTGYPLVVIAALGKDEQLATWRTGAAEHLLAAFVFAVLLGFIGFRLVGQVHRLRHAEQATAAATEEARTAAAQYRLIAENASDMVVTIDLQFVRRYVSPGCRDLLGYEPEELTDGTPLSLTHPEDVERITASLREMAAGRDRDLITNRVRHRDGHWVWVEVSLRLIRDPDTGAALEICTALRDITQRLATEAALRESERELQRSNADLLEVKLLNVASQHARALLEASLDPMVAISADGKITDVNEATVKITGVSRDALLGTDFCDYFTRPERAREGYRQAFAKGAITDFSLTIRHRNGTLTEVLYNASVYKDLAGHVLGVFAAARDVTALKRAEAEIAEQRRKELDRLAELELYERLTVGRELKMIDLKREILELQAKAAAAG